MTRTGVLAVAAAGALLAAGCVNFDGPSGSFQETLPVDGPVRVDLRAGSGSIQVRSGPPGEVRVRGEFRVRRWNFNEADRLAEDLESNPPIEQRGSLIRIGHDSRLRNVRVSYTVVVPEDTELAAETGSGSVHAAGLRRSARLSTGSGRIEASDIGGDLRARTGSGRIQLRGITGAVEADTGSGRIEITDAAGEVRARSGSGRITVHGPGRRIRVETGSGSVQVEGATDDLRVSTGSGSLRVQGHPAAGSFWLLETGSGGITIEVPRQAGFRLYARARDVDIEGGAPVRIEERSRREFRGTFGGGEARIEARTSSGSVRIR